MHLPREVAARALVRRSHPVAPGSLMSERLGATVHRELLTVRSAQSALIAALLEKRRGRHGPGHVLRDQCSSVTSVSASSNVVR